MSLQEWGARLQAYNANERAEWNRTLAVVNTMRGLVGGDPIDIDHTPKSKAEKYEEGRADYEAYKESISDWIDKHTN